MTEIALVNMPFADLKLPSLALTQLQGYLAQELGGRVKARVLYLNHDFARYLHLKAYRFFVDSMQAAHSGMGEWFFRQAAFPDCPDNSEDFFRRYYPRPTPRSEALRKFIEVKRAGLGAFLDELIDAYGLDRVSLVGFTSMFTQNVASLALARRLKERSPHTLVVMGGANCEFPMGREIVRNAPAVDYVFSGPGLKSFTAFVRSWLGGDLEACEAIPGVLTKRNHSSPTLRTHGEELPIEVEVPLDYREFLAEVRERFPDGEVRPNILFETSRGCWWGQKAHCTFCGLNGLSMGYRSMPPAQAVAHINRLFEYHDADGGTHFQAVDNIMPKSYPREVFPNLRPPASATLFYEVKADLTAEELGALSQAHVKRVQPGIEALDTGTLKLMRKGTNAFQNLALLKSCLTHDVFPDWNLLVGFPQEEEAVFERYAALLPRLVHLPPPSGVHQVRFDRFSPYFVRAAEYGLDLRPMGFYPLVYPFGPQSLFDLAYYFADGNGSAPYRVGMKKWLGTLEQQIGHWRQRWGKDQEVRPVLFVRTDESGTVVYDTREGEPVEHELSPVDRLVLCALERPQRLDDCRPPDASPEEVAASVEKLARRGLLFEENDRYLSLVLPRRPPEQTVAL